MDQINEARYAALAGAVSVVSTSKGGSIYRPDPRDVLVMADTFYQWLIQDDAPTSVVRVLPPAIYTPAKESPNLA